MEQWDWLDIARVAAAGLFGAGSVAAHGKWSRTKEQQQHRPDVEERMAEAERKIDATREQVHALQRQVDRGEIRRKEADGELHDRLNRVDALLAEVRELLAAR